MSDMGNVSLDLTDEQMIAWLALEGWVPWTDTPNRGSMWTQYWGVRREDNFACSSSQQYPRKPMWGTGPASDYPNQEHPCTWENIPGLDLVEIYQEVLRGFY